MREKFLAKDLYTHVSAVIPPDEERKWNTSKQFSLMKDSVFKSRELKGRLLKKTALGS